MNKSEYEQYLEDLKIEEQKILSENAILIKNFKDLCFSRGIEITDSNFTYNDRIGIVASYPKLLLNLNNNLKPDKEGLFNFSLLNKEYDKRKIASGLLYDKNYVALAHPYFRRQFCEDANYAPRFIDLYWHLSNEKIVLNIALDLDRVRVNTDEYLYFERDTWYGAKFNGDILKIQDGTSKLAAPLSLNEFENSFIFKDNYTLNVNWNTKSNMKAFQAEEFKNERIFLEYENEKFYPARYLHAVYNLEKNCFVHFDGAVHLYTEDEYFMRRDSDFNYTFKNEVQVKSKSIKLFKMDGEIPVDIWIEFSSQYFTGNPLIIEYFEGEYPERIKEILASIEKDRQIKK
jgi:hypothetical protein